MLSNFGTCAQPIRVDYTSMNISHAVLVYDRQLVTYTNHPIHSSYKPLREAIFVFVKVRYTVHYFFPITYAHVILPYVDLIV